jgi:hypothetical protein
VCGKRRKRKHHRPWVSIKVDWRQAMLGEFAGCLLAMVLANLLRWLLDAEVSPIEAVKDWAMERVLDKTSGGGLFPRREIL